MIHEILDLIGSLSKLQKEIQVHQKKSNRLIQRVVAKQSIFEGWSTRTTVPVDHLQLKYFLQFLIEVKSFLSKFSDKQYIFHSWKYNVDYEGFSDYNKLLIEFFQTFQLDSNLDASKFHAEDKQDLDEDTQTIISYIEKLPSLPTEITNRNITKDSILEGVRKDSSKSSNVQPQAEYNLDAAQLSELAKKITAAKASVQSNGATQLLSIEASALYCEKSHVNKLNDGKFGFLNYKGTYQDSLPVAIKYLPNMNATQTKLLQEEVATLQSLEGNHYFVKYYGLQHATPPYCLAFELIDFTLYEALYSREKPTLVIAKDNMERKLNILLECAIGLDFLHSLSIPHGDLKSGNVLIDTNGHVKLCGFGLLKTKQAVVPATATTASIAAKLQALLLISSPQYLAPEIYDSNSMDSITAASDIYSFGVLLNEVLDHAPPFPNLTAQNIATRLKRSDASSRPLLFGRNEDSWQTGNGLILELQALIKRCWDNAAATRPISKHVFQLINRILFGIKETDGGVSFSSEEVSSTTTTTSTGGVANVRKSFVVTTETTSTTTKAPLSTSSPGAKTLQRAVSRLKMIDFFESNIKRHAEANSTRPFPVTTGLKKQEGNAGPPTPSTNNTTGSFAATSGSLDERTNGSVQSEGGAAERSIVLEQDETGGHGVDSDDEANTNQEVIVDGNEEVLAELQTVTISEPPVAPVPAPVPAPIPAPAPVVATIVPEVVVAPPAVPAEEITISSSHSSVHSVVVNVPEVVKPPTPDILEMNHIDSTNTVIVSSTITQEVITTITEEEIAEPEVIPVVPVSTKPSPDTIFKINTLFYQASNCGSKAAQEELLALVPDYPLAEVFLMGMLCYGSGIEKDLARAQEIAHKSIDWLLTLAASEDPTDGPANMYAQYLTGICYEQGLAVAKDEKEAVKYYTLSANQGYAGAQSNLGYCYKHGQGVSRDMHEALRLYTLGAEQGHATAQNNLGYCYQHGQGIGKDLTKAVHYYKLSAEQGHATAQNNLGYCYQYGQGVAPDIHAAVKLYRQSADQGCAFGQNSLGHCYKRGHGVPKNLHEAVKYYRLSAEQGHATAQNNLGYCFQYGQGVEKDLQQAVQYYKQSAEQGHATAQNNLGYCFQHGYGVPKSLKDAARYYHASAEQGYAAAQFNLGHCYINGIGVEKNYSEAVKLFRYSAEQGNASAQYNLGHCYELGQGVEKNKSEAIRWYQAAAERGDEAAITALKKLSR